MGPRGARNDPWAVKSGEIGSAPPTPRDAVLTSGNKRRISWHIYNGGWQDEGPAAARIHAAESVRGGARRRRLTLVETYIAGTAYYEARRVRGALRPGELLVLRREPDNAYDELAIEVFTGAGAKLGYVPRADNEPFARLLDAGETVTAAVIDVDPARYDDIHMALALRTA